MSNCLLNVVAQHLRFYYAVAESVKNSRDVVFKKRCHQVFKKRCHQGIFCSEIEVFLVKKRPYMLYIIFQTVETGNNRNK